VPKTGVKIDYEFLKKDEKKDKKRIKKETFYSSLDTKRGKKDLLTTNRKGYRNFVNLIKKRIIFY